jgi:hypothetical protein
VAGDSTEPCGHVNICGRWNGHYPCHDATPSHLGCYSNARWSQSLPCLVISWQTAEVSCAIRQEFT